jgi:hypothetical protein
MASGLNDLPFDFFISPPPKPIKLNRDGLAGRYLGRNYEQEGGEQGGPAGHYQMNQYRSTYGKGRF